MKFESWAGRLTLKMIDCGNWDLPFYLAIGDKLFGTYRVAHRLGELFVVCGCSILESAGIRGVRIIGFHIMRRGSISYVPQRV